MPPFTSTVMLPDVIGVVAGGAHATTGSVGSSTVFDPQAGKSVGSARQVHLELLLQLSAEATEALCLEVEHVCWLLVCLLERQPGGEPSDEFWTAPE